ncbi:MAG: epoxide hydrolase [Proteobacteria bacterium]|nr:epoxide hydrolase [Pseudomonadota bacterium]MDA1031032.1 epoxide hydrolase [Pseudomonadota bacterium]
MLDKEVTPFTLSVPDSELSDLKQRLKNTRWPDEIPNNNWSYGADLGYLKDLCAYWENDYDWRAHEAVINQFKQYKTKVAGIDLHFIYEEGKGENPQPLLLSHGWPGSVYEFHKIIPMLTDPVSYGGSAEDSFTVIAPSLPGYTFSFKPGQARFSVEEITDAFAELMTKVLGFKSFVAQGGDWGGFVTSRMGFVYPELLKAIHLNFLAVRRDPSILENPSEEEAVFLKQLNEFLKDETGYQWIQGTKPQTLAYGLTDSPVGLAAWLVEKFHTWTDHQGDLDGYFGRDTMLTDIMLYWTTGAIGSSFWPYYARMHSPWPIPIGKTVDVPTGYIQFPKEILSPPRSVADLFYSNIQSWTECERGGHFAALEQPELLVKDMRQFFRAYR